MCVCALWWVCEYVCVCIFSLSSRVLVIINPSLYILVTNMNALYSQAQVMTNSTSHSLITSVQQATMTKETVTLMRQLLDNYVPQTTRPESQTSAERAEENRFLEAVMRTPLMQRLEAILQQKGGCLVSCSKVTSGLNGGWAGVDNADKL